MGHAAALASAACLLLPVRSFSFVQRDGLAHCVAAMPTNEDGREHQPQLELPAGLQGDTACFVIRYTGELHVSYE